MLHLKLTTRQGKLLKMCDFENCSVLQVQTEVFINGKQIQFNINNSSYLICKQPYVL